MSWHIDFISSLKCRTQRLSIVFDLEGPFKGLKTTLSSNLGIKKPCLLKGLYKNKMPL